MLSQINMGLALLLLVFIVVAVGALTNWGRNTKGYTGAWWWLVFSFVLSPVGLLRLEGITASRWSS